MISLNLIKEGVKGISKFILDNFEILKTGYVLNGILTIEI
jgi:hypothetical protein